MYSIRLSGPALVLLALAAACGPEHTPNPGDIDETPATVAEPGMSPATGEVIDQTPAYGGAEADTIAHPPGGTSIVTDSAP